MSEFQLRFLWRSFGLFDDANKNSRELIAFLTQAAEIVKRRNIGCNWQLKPIRRLLDFTKAITAFGNKLMRSSPDSLPLTLRGCSVYVVRRPLTPFRPAATSVCLPVIRADRGARTQKLSSENLRFGGLWQFREHPNYAQSKIFRSLPQIHFWLLHFRFLIHPS